MRQRVRAEDEPGHARPSGRPADDRSTAAPVDAVLDAAARATATGRGGADAVGRGLAGLGSAAGNAAVAGFLSGRRGADHVEGSVRVAAGRAALANDPAPAGGAAAFVAQRAPDDEEETVDEVAAAPTGDDVSSGAGPTGEAAGEAAGDGPTGATTGDAPTADGGATELGGKAPTPGPSWTHVGPPTNTTYAVSGSLRTVANAVAARKEAGSVSVTPTRDTETWEPPGGTEAVTAARVTVDQVVELPTWTDKDQATPKQQAEWDRFHAAITKHEAGHVALDRTAYAGTHTKMVGKSPADATTAYNGVVTQAETDNETYDTGNQHGLTQGTGINANIDEVTKVP